MTETTLPARNEIPAVYTWNAPSVFPTPQDWEREVRHLEAECTRINADQDRLAKDPASLLKALQEIEIFMARVQKVIMYAAMSHQVDMNDQAAARMNSQARGLTGRALSAISFLDPGLLSIGQQTLERWMEAEPGLQIYRHYFDNLFRSQAHIRSAEVEELLGGLADPFSGASSAANVLINADFRYKPAVSADGKELPVTDSSLDKILGEPDREARRTSWESYTDTFLAYQNTLATMLSTYVKQNVFNMRARHYPSTLEAALFPPNIPVEVFHNLIETFRRNLPTWHRYWAVRRKALGVHKLYPYDIWAPLVKNPPQITYQQSVDFIAKGLKPMGEEYVQILRRGALEERWVDVYPNLGKTAGAFSYGSPGTYPFIVMSFNEDISSLSTLAHELGHSMHSYLTWQTQPILYSEYSTFVAEVASNFHQAMVRASLLKDNPDPDFQISVIEEAMSNFHRYFFIMPTLARFELEIHQRAERGEGLTADQMDDLMADLFQEGYGNEMEVDRARVGITWATFGHMYMNYYVFQYATGISAAHALAGRILEGQPGAVEAYLEFLKAGGSDYPLNILRKAGVDLTSPEPVERAFRTLAGYVDRLEKWVEARS